MGGAVRVGATVRRTAGPWRPTVQRLLAHLRARGVTEVPEPLGVDTAGRDVTSYLPGTVPQYPLPSWVWTDDVLVEAARLLRRVHDASVDFDRGGAVWRLPAHEPAEVVCHDDAAPYNLVLRDGHVTGLVDWDTAAPGPRVWDLAYLAYRLVPLGPAAADPAASGSAASDAAASGAAAIPLPERARRLRLLCGAYDGPAPAEVLAVVPERLRELAAFTRERAQGDAELLGHAASYTADARWVAEAGLALAAP
jgi:hypothetical protein